MITNEDFKNEVFRLAEEIEAKPKELHIRSMRTKWASCSNKGRITFSSSLLSETSEVRTKVILHELLHLKYPNHGKMFKTLFASYLHKRGIDCSFEDYNLRVR